MDLIHIDWSLKNPYDINNFIVRKELEITPLTRENSPEQFEAWANDYQFDFNALYRIKDPNEAILIDEIHSL